MAAVHYPDGPTLRAQVLRQRAKYEDVILDVGGRDTGPLRAALLLADLVLVPVQPAGLDVWALAAIAALIEEARGLRDGLHAVAMLNRADPGISADNTHTAAAVADFPGLWLPDAPLVRRKAFANAAARGVCVDELDTIDPKSSQELRRLVMMVFDHENDMEEQAA
jgi:chromosome partitioning protein